MTGTPIRSCLLLSTLALSASSGWAQRDSLFAIASTDFPDANLLDSDGDGIDGNGVGPIFVSQTLGNDANPGTRAAPMQTVQAAIFRSRALQQIEVIPNGPLPYRRPIYVATVFGQYGESLVVDDWIPGVYGGYDSVFTSRTAALTRFSKDRPVQMHLTTNRAFEQDFSFQNLSFQGLFIGVFPPPGTHGIGIVIHNLIPGGIGFQNVSVLSPRGTNGTGLTGAAAAGTNGGQGQPGGVFFVSVPAAGGLGGLPAPKGGAGGSSDPFHSGINAESGFAGEGPSAGSGGLGGARGDGVLTVATNGGVGLPGGAGVSGTNGARAASLNDLSGLDGSPGTAGSGGGGGGGGGIYSPSLGSGWSGGGGGGGGAAGQGGSGGKAGIRGGSSFALLSNQTTFIRTNGLSLTTTGGGNGGPGQPGGNGGVGGSGGPGGNGLFVNSLEYSGNGGAGGKGGDGGSGGHGAGGNGGSSIPFVARTGTQGNYVNRTLTVGAAGTGGTSPGISGSNGSATTTAFPNFSVDVFPYDELRTHAVIYCVNSQAGASTATGIPMITEPRPGVAEGFTILSFDAVSAQGGTVTKSGNTFSYTAPGTFTGMDSFAYSVRRESDSQVASGVCAVYVATVSRFVVIPGDYLGSKSGFSGVFEMVEGGRVIRRQPFTTDAGGGFFGLFPVGAGLVDYRIKVGHWLSYGRQFNVALGGGVGFELIPSVNGDVDGDDSITIFDYIDLSESFMLSTGDAGFKPFADLDGDGEVTIFDYIILSGNFGLEGPTGP